MPAGPRGAQDEVVFGRAGDAAVFPAYLARHMGRIIAAIVIACLAATVMILAVGRVTSSPARPSAPVKLLDGNTMSLRLKEAAGAELDVQYFQAGGGSESAWITIAATGLPPGYDYVATAGECRTNGSRALAVSSGLPDPATDILVLSLADISASQNDVIWVKLANSSGVQLGGVRGPFLPPNDGMAIAPGRPACP